MKPIKHDYGNARTFVLKQPLSVSVSCLHGIITLLCLAALQAGNGMQMTGHHLPCFMSNSTTCSAPWKSVSEPC